KADVDTFAPVLPSRALADGTIAAGLQAPLFVRLRSADGILPGSVWAEARTASAKYETSQWVPVDDAANTDGWAAFTPEAPWAEGDIVTLTVGATTTSGETVGPIAYVFTATADASMDVVLP